jgi:hypothetical protein
MTLIEQHNDPNNTTQSIISGLVGNSFKKDWFWNKQIPIGINYWRMKYRFEKLSR